MTAQTVVMNHVLDSLARLMCHADRRYCVILSVRLERNQKKKGTCRGGMREELEKGIFCEGTDRERGGGEGDDTMR